MRRYAALLLLCLGMSTTAYAQDAECDAFSDEDVAKVTSMAADLMHNPPEGPVGVDKAKRASLKLDMTALRGQAESNAVGAKSCCEKKGSSCCESGESACCKRKIARGDTNSAFASAPFDGATKTMEGRCKRKGR